MEQIYEILINNFDISYMLSINILTYMIIKFIDFLNGEKKLKLIYKRLVLILSTIVCCIIYHFVTDLETRVLINSTIAAPVFYSWAMKPLLKKIKLQYNTEE